MRTYTLCAPGKWIIFVVLTIQTCAFAAVGIWAIFGSDPNSPPGFVAVFLIAIPCFLWFRVLSTPHLITLEIDGTATFVSLIRSRQFHLREIVSLRPAGNEFGFFKIDFGHGKQKFLAQFTGFHDFVRRLKEANPNAVILGC
ncbi:MAG: hypothetical protein QOE82_816 [Thermoanaerobaculia bacterium]|nr:hypothetical protein [Thermoanaerobaculia bacterium]